MLNPKILHCKYRIPTFLLLLLHLFNVCFVNMFLFSALANIKASCTSVIDPEIFCFERRHDFNDNYLIGRLWLDHCSRWSCYCYKHYYSIIQQLLKPKSTWTNLDLKPFSQLPVHLTSSNSINWMLQQINPVKVTENAKESDPWRANIRWRIRLPQHCGHSRALLSSAALGQGFMFINNQLLLKILPFCQGWIF